MVSRLYEVGISNCFISELTLGELYFGAFKSEKKKHFDDVIEILKLFEQVPISYCLREYGDIRWQLERSGQKLDSMDLLIGATALHGGFVLVTGNVKHFERIPNITIENWM